MTSQGIGFAIDFGEVTAAMSAALGAGMGITDQKMLSRAIESILIREGAKFGEYTDSVGESQLPHVYEYKSAWSGQDVNASRSGRLWNMNFSKAPAGMSMVIDLSTKSTVFAQPDPELLAAAPGMASHRFPTKAEHLESNKVLRATPGVQRFTERDREPRTPGGPKVLVFLEGGQVKFRSRQRTWENEFAGRFEKHFQAYWQLHMVDTSKQNMRKLGPNVSPNISREIVRAGLSARAGAMSSRVMTGRILMLDSGRPFTGIRQKPAIVNKTKATVSKRFEKELVRAWT